MPRWKLRGRMKKAIYFFMNELKDKTPVVETIDYKDVRESLKRRAEKVSQLVSDDLRQEMDWGVIDRIEFLNTDEFRQVIIENPKDFGVDYDNKAEVEAAVQRIGGIRLQDGSRVIVQTQRFDNGKWRLATKAEVLETATHEMVHGLLVPKVTDKGDDERERKTGYKVVTLRWGDVPVKTEGRSVYEAQTDLITSYLCLTDGQTPNNKNPMLQPCLFGVSELIKLGFNNSENDGMGFLINQYYSCDEKFVGNLLGKINIAWKMTVPQEISDSLIETASLAKKLGSEVNFLKACVETKKFLVEEKKRREETKIDMTGWTESEKDIYRLLSKTLEMAKQDNITENDLGLIKINIDKIQKVSEAGKRKGE